MRPAVWPFQHYDWAWTLCTTVQNIHVGFSTRNPSGHSLPLLSLHQLDPDSHISFLLLQSSLPLRPTEYIASPSSRFSLAVSTVANAVSFTPSFETSLRGHLKTINADTTAYPPLQTTILMIPTDVKGWAQKSLKSCNLTLEDLETKLKGSLLQSLMAVYPAQADKVHKFIHDGTEFVTFFRAGIESGDVNPASSPASTRPPLTVPPRPTTVRSSDGSGSKEDPSEITWTSYTYTSRPTYSTPVPPYVSSNDDSSCSFRWLKFLLLAVAVIGCVGKALDSYSDKQKKKEEEEKQAAAAAALQGEAGESSQAVYVVVKADSHTPQKL